MEKVQELSGKIDNFKDCYKDCILWSSVPDGDVEAEQILDWSIDNSYTMDIANDIKKLTQEL
jgi:hypothetical protein